MKRSMVAFVLLVWLCAVNPVLAGQGQWAGFLYLVPKASSELGADQKSRMVDEIKEAAREFHNDFKPDSQAQDTIEFLKGVKFDLMGKAVDGPSPVALIRVESTDIQKVDDFFATVGPVLAETFFLDFRMGVTGQLNYTNTETLARLKKEAPKRGDGKEQPNAVAFPLSKSAEWWALPTDRRTELFSSHEDKFGKGHLGHNGVGFLYISKIYRKLYHSRFIDPQQDFMTYFEFADADKPVFESLLSGLRDTAKNQEWKYVKEGPIFWGKRVEGPEKMF